MKKIILTVGTLLAVMSVYAQSNVIVTNSVTGNGNTSSIQQTMQAVYAADNKASVTILGDNNSATLKQNGGGLQSSITQMGDANLADVTQMGAYGANSTYQGATNDGLNNAVVFSVGQGIVSQVYQTADGTGSSNDISVTQAGDNSYLGSQQYATAGGTNAAIVQQFGFGDSQEVIQEANGAGSNNEAIALNGGFSIGNAGLTDQTATNGGGNASFLYQDSDYAPSTATITQTADGAGSSNTSVSFQNDLTIGGGNTTAITQDAQTGGINQVFTDQQGVFGDLTINQTASNGATNLGDILQLDQYLGNFNIATLTQTADGAGGGNDATIIQGDYYNGGDGATYAFATVTQTATNSGVNQTYILQEGDLPGVNEVVVTQTVDSYDGFNDMFITQSDFTDFAYTETIQEATDAGSNIGEVYQDGDYEETYIDQTADGVGSANRAYVLQTGDGTGIGFAPIADIVQDATNGGKNNSDSYQSGSDDFTSVVVNQTADGTDSQNNSFADQTGIAIADITQNAAAGGVNNATSYQDGLYIIGTVEQDASGAGSTNNAFVNQYVDAYFSDALIGQSAQSGGINNGTINQDGFVDGALIVQGAGSAGSINTATINQGIVSGGGSVFNSAEVYQTAVLGGQNEASITQDGFGNSARIDQVANAVGFNLGSITQLGVGNQAFINQLGTGNTATETQTGDNDTAIVNQTGKGNKAAAEQVGNNDSFTLTQMGNNNTATIIQTGNNQVGGITNVVGNSNTTTITQN